MIFILVSNNIHQVSAASSPPCATANEIMSGVQKPPNWCHCQWDISALNIWWDRPWSCGGCTYHWYQSISNPTGSEKGKLGPFLLQLAALMWLEVRLSMSVFRFCHDCEYFEEEGGFNRERDNYPYIYEGEILGHGHHQPAPMFYRTDSQRWGGRWDRLGLQQRVADP